MGSSVSSIRYVQLTDRVNQLKGTRTYTAITTMRHQVSLTSFVHCYDHGDLNFSYTQSTMFAFIRTKENSFPATKRVGSSNGIYPRIFARTNWYQLQYFCLTSKIEKVQDASW